jgi:hypothetical protein
MSDSYQATTPRKSRLTFSVVAGALLVLASAVSVAAGGPDTPVGSTPPGSAPTGDGATRIKPDPTVTNLHRTAFDHLRISADGKRVVVYFWMGVQACNGLGRVDVSRHDGQLKIKLWTGIPAGAENLRCIELAQLYKTVIHLKRPIVVPGL